MVSDHDSKSSRPPPFVEVITGEGKCRRFAAGTKAGFALERINSTLKETEGGVGKFSHIESVKDGEEAVDFGPGSELVSYGEGWQLRAVKEVISPRPIQVGTTKLAIRAAQTGVPKSSIRQLQVAASKPESTLLQVEASKPDGLMAVSSLEIVPLSNVDEMMPDSNSGAVVPISSQNEMAQPSNNQDEAGNGAITSSNGAPGKVAIELPLPVSGTYNSLDELLEDLRQFTRKNGYNVIKDKKKSPYVYQLRCDKSKMPRKAESKVPEHKRRKSSSKRTGCPFRMRAIFKEQKWTFVSSNSIHNHGPREIK